MTKTYILDYEDYLLYLYDYIHRVYRSPYERSKYVKTEFGNPPTRRYPELLVCITIKTNPFRHLYLNWILRKVKWHDVKENKRDRSKKRYSC